MGRVLICGEFSLLSVITIHSKFLFMAVIEIVYRLQFEHPTNVDVNFDGLIATFLPKLSISLWNLSFGYTIF